MHMTLKYIDISKWKKNNIMKTESVFEKGQIYLQICQPFAWKMYLTLQKAACEAKNASRGTITYEQWK